MSRFSRYMAATPASDHSSASPSELISTSPGFGLLFVVVSNSTEPDGALSGQYLGIFSNATVPTAAPLFAVEFDVGRNPEFNDPDNNHVGIDLNNIESAETAPAGYYNTSGDLIPVNMRNGQNIHAWIEFDGPRFEINITIAPIGVSRPSRPLLTFKNPVIANYLSSEMFVGFSASKTTWVETQRVLAWSFSDNGVSRDINTTNLPVFTMNSSSSSLSSGAIAGITIGSVSIFLLCLSISYWVWRNRQRKKLEDDEIEDWELEYWPHRFSYEELHQATNGFSNNELLGAGGFGRVYRGTLPNNTEVAVKCVSHDSKQGLREFMAEISSMGRLQHKNLVPMRGWCRKEADELGRPEKSPCRCGGGVELPPPRLGPGGDSQRYKVEQHSVGRRNARTGGDFGLAKLYTHGEVPNTTRVVGTLGYLAPELAMAVAGPTEASDVYGFGVVVLEVVCGRRPIEAAREREEEVVLIDWVREKYGEGKVWEAADGRIKGEYKAEEIEAVLKLGLACCHPNPVHRPTMREVVTVLVGGEVAAAVPRVLLSELSQGGGIIGGCDGSGGDGSGEKVLLPEVSV
ncbi:concanavalin A-like lectin protein kinase family protein [Actinidia rufa]|uniref:Concanavalin A-like lectin protein kinase family protein n=1 Tax=Actinidia rufa TaxID=165716 RepID=A0A7J0FZ78_9ERIC|nr:concanavalin A-like lectin protein kinase family protein [Actinidia rufa]